MIVPLTKAPDDWNTNGLEYGIYCQCNKCNRIERSTVVFDFYADGPGKPLICETCTTGLPHEQVVEFLNSLEENKVFEKDAQ